MNMKTLAGVLTLSFGAICLNAMSVFAAEGGARCQDVGGGVLTNFLDSTHTEGTSSGDIKGAVGVQILGISGNIYHVQHHWVTRATRFTSRMPF
jgi:hypothetical protein